MTLNLHFIFEKGEKYFIGYCPEIPGANGQGKTVDDCRENLQQAIELILETRAEEA